MKLLHGLKIYCEENKINIVCHLDRDEISFILSKYVMENVSLPYENTPYKIYGNNVHYIYNKDSQTFHAEIEIKARKATEEPKK